MVNINFIPDDYIQNNESRRTNLICIALLLVILVAIAAVFGTIKMRQHTLNSRESAIDAELAKEKEQIKTVEQLQKQRNAMWSAAITTVELIDPVPKSVLLASITNCLPKGVSLLRLTLSQKDIPANTSQKPPANKYQELQDKEKSAATQNTSKEKLLETHISIEGAAPSDIEVAAFIENLSRSFLLTDVALVESAQMSKSNAKQDTPDETMRRFKLTAVLRKDIQLTEKNVEQIAYKGGNQTDLND